jgi:hypothetical protein
MYSLHDIESGILRANRKAVASFFRPFSKHDPRLAFALPEPEPMIHFALVCGAKSCPPIKTYTAQVSVVELMLQSSCNYSLSASPFIRQLVTIIGY